MKRTLCTLLILVSLQSFGQPETQLFWSQASTTCPPTDADANAFITAAGLTSDRDKNPIYCMIKEMKENSLWASKLPAVWPIAGSTASSQKFNLMDPRDLDAAYRLTFTNTIHDSTGVDGDGATSWADTHYPI